VVVLPTPTGDPRSVRVEVTYSHQFLFGIINNVPNSFTAGATRPGNYDTAVGVCNATPIIPPTHTPLPTFTSTRTSTPLPTATRTPVLPTATRTATRTATASNTPVPPTPTCVPHAESNICARRDNTNRWSASIQISNFRPGDSVSVQVCNNSGSGCHGLTVMSCTGTGSCTRPADSDTAAANEKIFFIFTPGPGSCALTIPSQNIGSGVCPP
jgi:cell division septation protein DedD